jgi:hypothetical protein
VSDAARGQVATVVVEDHEADAGRRGHRIILPQPLPAFAPPCRLLSGPPRSSHRAPAVPGRFAP